MNPDQENDYNDEFDVELDMNDVGSVDDFLKQLEEREKDLDIATDSIVELDDDSADVEAIPDFMLDELSQRNGSGAAPAKRSTPQPAVDVAKYTKEIDQLKAKVAKMEADREEMFKNSQRRVKDFENYKSRTERERQETFKNQVTNLANQMIPVLDNLNRALDFVDNNMTSQKSAEFQQFFDGIVMVNQQVNEVFAGMGVVPVPAIGELFDPHLHEAVATEESNEHAPNTIVEEMLRGYKLGDQVIRHSMVKVVVLPAEAQEKPQEQLPNLPQNNDPMLDVDADAGLLSFPDEDVDLLLSNIEILDDDAELDLD